MDKKHICGKCREYINGNKGVARIIEAEVVYYFCDDCMEIAKDQPKNTLYSFCLKNDNYLKFKMDRAKKKREEGKSPWIVKHGTIDPVLFASQGSGAIIKVWEDNVIEEMLSEPNKHDYLTNKSNSVE